MTHTPDIPALVERLREAMAGVSQDEWIVGPFGHVWIGKDIEYRDGRWGETTSTPRIVHAPGSGPESKAITKYIAECNPVAVSVLLDALTYQAERIAVLEAALAVDCVSTPSDARTALAEIVAGPDGVTPADRIISQIEALFPDWRSYRDLIDCIECTLHRLKEDSHVR